MADQSYWNRAGIRQTVTRRRALGVGAAGAGAAFLAACGGSNNNGGAATKAPTSAATAATSAATAATSAATAAGTAAAGSPAATRAANAPAGGSATAAATETPVRGGTLRRVSGINELAPDPHISVSIGIYAWCTAIYTYLGAFNNVSQMFSPIFAESFEQKGPTDLVFHLRKGVKWHNIAPVNAREVTADDVLYSMQRFRDLPQAQNNSFYKDVVDKMEVVDPYTFHLTTKQPYAETLGEIGSIQVAMVAKEAVEKFGDLSANFIGAGPFTVDQFTRNEKMVLKRNPDYFDKTLPYIDGSDWTTIIDTSTALEAYKTDKVDIGAGVYRREGALLTKLDYDDLTKNPKLNNYKQPSLNYGTLGINASVAPYNDKRVRQAFWVGTDRQQFIDKIEQGEATPQGVLSNGLTFWVLSQDEIKPYIAYDPQKAKQLLSAAGFPNGFDMTIETSGGVQSYVDYSEVLVAELKKIGINAKVTLTDLPTYLSDKLFKGNFTVTVFTHNPYESPKVPIGFYHKNGIGNGSWFHYANEDISKAIDAENGETDLNKRQQLVKAVQKMIMEDAAPLMPFITGSQYYSWHKRVGGLDPTVRNFQYQRYTEFIKPGV